MNVSNYKGFAGWLNSLPDTQKYLVGAALVFGPLALASSAGYGKQARMLALLIFGTVVVKRLVPVIESIKPPAVARSNVGPHATASGK